MVPLAEPEDSEYGVATQYGTAFHRYIVETVEEQEILMQEMLSLRDLRLQV